MNAPERIAFLPQIQALADSRHLRVDAVSINGVRYPRAIRNRPLLPTIAVADGGLPAVKTGTHMSRFIELLEARTEALDQEGFKALLLVMLGTVGCRLSRYASLG